MSETPIDLNAAITELATALKPLEALAESMRGLDRSHRLQADLQLIEHYYPEEYRYELYAQLEKAHKAEAKVIEANDLHNKRKSDQRTFEQYSDAKGPDQAKLAFMTDDEFRDMRNAAEKETNELRAAHPVLFRVHAQTKKSW